VDADDHTRLNGAEKRHYQKLGFEGMPYNRPFDDLEEMLLVDGMAELDAFRPDWRDWFTIHGDGRVEVNDANPRIISLLADAPMERVANVMTFRAGADGMLRTPDDVRIGSAAQLAQLLGIHHPRVVEQLNRWTAYEGSIRRIESTGEHGGVCRRLVLITQRDAVLWRGELPPSENASPYFF
jgi:general secretion pathway protein K